MPFVYIGRTHTLFGKSLWEITGSLKGGGVGRMVIRNRYKRYTEPCFMRIISVKPQMDEDNRLGTLFVEEVFRGFHQGVKNMSRVAYKPDHTLIPKHEEHLYIKAFEEYTLKDVKIFAPTAEMPPLLKLIAEQRGHHATIFHMGFKEVEKPSPRARLAQEGETPTVIAACSLGPPAAPRLYEGVLNVPLPNMDERLRQESTQIKY